MKVIPINNGYAQVKSIDGKIFKSKIMKASFDEVTTTADVLVYDGETYIIGEGSPNLEPDKTEAEDTKLYILNMLSKFVDGSKEVFKILVTAPPGLYKNQKELLPNYLRGDYKIKVKKDNDFKDIEIHIADCKVFPESIVAAYVNNWDYYKTKKLFLLDIGGCTTNGILLDRGNFNADTVFNLRNGCYHLFNRLADYFNDNYGKDIDADDMEYFINEGYLPGKDGENLLEVEKDYIEHCYKQHIKEAIDKAVLKKWDIKSYETLVLGGGGLFLFETIKKFLPRAKIAKDPVFDTLHGLELLAERVYK